MTSASPRATSFPLGDTFSQSLWGGSSPVCLPCRAPSGFAGHGQLGTGASPMCARRAKTVHTRHSLRRASLQQPSYKLSPRRLGASRAQHGAVADGDAARIGSIAPRRRRARVPEQAKHAVLLVGPQQQTCPGTWQTRTSTVTHHCFHHPSPTRDASGLATNAPGTPPRPLAVTWVTTVRCSAVVSSFVSPFKCRPCIPTH